MSVLYCFQAFVLSALAACWQEGHERAPALSRASQGPIREVVGPLVLTRGPLLTPGPAAPFHRPRSPAPAPKASAPSRPPIVPQTPSPPQPPPPPPSLTSSTSSPAPRGFSVSRVWTQHVRRFRLHFGGGEKPFPSVHSWIFGGNRGKNSRRIC